MKQKKTPHLPHFGHVASRSDRGSTMWHAGRQVLILIHQSFVAALNRTGRYSHLCNSATHEMAQLSSLERCVNVVNKDGRLLSERSRNGEGLN